VIFDRDALIAGCDLVGRSGALGLECGYLHDDVPLEEASWYATARYHGAKLIVENHRSPVDAVEALARRILGGGTCAHCLKPVQLDDRLALTGCRWTRQGARWARGCEPTSPQPAGERP
jgi:hypothetical protein